MTSAANRVRDAIEALIADVDRSVMRPQQKQAYKCCYDCCDNDKLTGDQLQQCIQNCTITVQTTEEIVNRELSQFQERLQRCANLCQERARDEMPIGDSVSSGVRAKLQESMDSCIDKCAEEQLRVLPKVMERIKYYATHQSRR
ncbi:hypothetical protein CBR_g3774 [Chara braunii]|uniref:Protein FAM136A n=1 Tax=Chara braunii TaxID=69332 RepID=A0A388KGA0_CHABU|nr:hypothetical protein CBR_g3774 [Chara braunii]|eukprot:GBG69075.1 hypothetical protein CBR_g3774 [Chara braunii]